MRGRGPRLPPSLRSSPDSLPVSALPIARLAGLLLGAAVTATLVVGWHITAPLDHAAASVAFTASPTGELGVSPAGAFVNAPHLQAGAPATRGELAVRNQTRVPLAVDVRLRTQTGDLDDLLRVRVRGSGRLLFDGTLGGLRRGIDPLVLRPGASRRLRVAVTLPAGDGRAAAGRADAVAILLRTTPAEASP